MKKILFVALLAVASLASYAQPRAIGVRMGEFDGISYQHGFGDSNMLEIEAGFNIGNYWGNRMVGWEDGHEWHMYGHNVQAAVTYDWIDPFGATFSWSNRGEWHWYLGVGAAGGFGWSARTYIEGHQSDPFDRNWGFAAGVARCGIEYTFWFPLQLSLDYRPTIGAGLAGIPDPITNKTIVDAGLYYDIFGLCLSARYRF
jgi:hypothetical protein